MVTQAERQEATGDLVGALCYALLGAFQVAARGTTMAPSIPLAERQAGFAVGEFERYRTLLARLEGLSPDPGSAMQALRGPLDSFFEAARAEGWLETQVFHFVGDTITTDFAEILAPRLDTETAEAVRLALTNRAEQEAFALRQIADALQDDAEKAQEQIARFAGAMVGEALSRLRQALLESDALQIVLGEGSVKELVLEILGRHRERLERLGLDTIDE